MADPQVRREIALRAAQLMYARECVEYFQAKRRAAEQVRGRADGRHTDLPSNAEIREHVQMLVQMLEGQKRGQELRAMRLEALRFLRLLERYKPKLIGSVLTGHIREGSDIDLHVFCDSNALVTETIEREGYAFEVERKHVRKHGAERLFTHVHVDAAFRVELSVYRADQANFPFRSSITGRTIERADAQQLESLLRESEPGIDIDAELERAGDRMDPFDLYVLLLKPLEAAKQNPKYHPEGDALYHSLQVFELARGARPWDQEFALAALLHDVGKGIDATDHVAAGLEALEGNVSARVAWLIEHHMEAHACHDGTIGARARRRLAASPDFEDLLLLAELDKAGRRGGVEVPTVEEAVEWLRTQGEEQ
jgi:predicted nucleotidyltransferase